MASGAGKPRWGGWVAIAATYGTGMVVQDTFCPSVGRSERASYLVHQAAPHARAQRPKLLKRQT